MARPRFLESLPTWRKLALSTWDAPRDPTAYGTVDIACESALAYATKVSEASGVKVTLTHIVGKAAALAIAEVPEVNGYVSRGRLALRDTVDVFFQVSFSDAEAPSTEPSALSVRAENKPRSRKANLAGAKVSQADGKSVVQIASELGERARAIRNHTDTETVRGAQTLARLPTSIVGGVTRLGAYLSYDLGLDLSRLGIPQDAFGSCMVTNVGVFGIRVGLAPLVDMSRVPLVVTIGAVHDAAGVRDGQVVVEKRVTLGVAFDHRVMDGFHAGVLSRKFVDVLSNPEVHLSSP